MKKIPSGVLLFTLASFLQAAVIPGTAFGYNDVVDSKTKTAIQELGAKGMFTDFIGRFGKEFFRPTGTVAREDLILVLHEYEKILGNLRANQKDIVANTESLRKEIQNVRSEVYKLSKDKGKIKKDDAAEPVNVKTSDIDKDLMDSLEIRTRNLVHRVNKLVAKTDDLDSKVGNITSGGKTGGSNLLSKISLLLSIVAIAIAAQ